MKQLMIQVGQTYTLRNGLVTSPIRKANNGTGYIFEAEVQEPNHKTPSVECWLRSGKNLTNSINHRLDIIK